MLILLCYFLCTQHVAVRTDGDSVKDSAKHSKRFNRAISKSHKVSKVNAGKDAGREKQRHRSQSASSGARRRVDNGDHEELLSGTTEHVMNGEQTAYCKCLERVHF